MKDAQEPDHVSLTTRRTIDEASGGDVAKLPPHVLQNIEERLQAAARKNAALDLDRFETLAGKLDYVDLRELQDTILSKALWSLFQTRFTNKEMLSKRLDQLAELRNGIRQSRTVDEVTRKEGEAAQLWLRQLVAR